MQEIWQLIRSEISGAWRYRWWGMIAAWFTCVGGWLFVFSMPDIYDKLEETARLHLLLRGQAVRPLTPAQAAEVRAAFPPKG